MKSIAIQTERLSMAQITHVDFDLFKRLQTEHEVIELCFDKPSDEDIQARFDERLPTWCKCSEEWLCLVVSLKHTGEAVGVTGFKVSNGYAEVGYLLLPEFHGCGIGTESLEGLVKWAERDLDLNRFSAIVTKGNRGSERVLEKCGFVLTKVEKDAYQIGGQTFDDHIFHRG
ncbi:GNAT family N-acetyltransferase [Vibrio wakamikoensis]|uniref:GNAT family N-acetyltransferase n=1 Tax=Vibrio wakamikoensis TaxID=2910251 RepID=UPI003D1F46FD